MCCRCPRTEWARSRIAPACPIRRALVRNLPSTWTVVPSACTTPKHLPAWMSRAHCARGAFAARSVAAFAFRAGESADQKDDGASVGVRAGGQPAVDLSRGEMPGVELLSAQEPRQQLGGKIVG